ncbi:hypothetical protein BHM03_00044227 [Ensete ventricosum]|nr:hypothetical protein BHM03_00044227 [Ensete ventricosum]
MHHHPDATTPDGEIQDNTGPLDHSAPTVDTTRKLQGELQIKTQSSWSLSLVNKADLKRAVRRELAKGIRSLPRWHKGVRQKKIETHRKIVRCSRKGCQEFAERIEKLAGNTSGDRQKKTIRLTVRMPEAAEFTGRWVYRHRPGFRAADDG